MNNLQNLHTTFNQSPWIDNLSRDLINSGQLQSYIDQGIRGMTSNPTIFEKAIANTDLYDEQIAQLASQGKSAEEIYWQIAIDDVRSAAKLFEPIFNESGGKDGFVSLEVSPLYAADIEATFNQAKELWAKLASKNVMIKVPATPSGIPVIQRLLAEGINVNITLLFSLDRYREVIEAYKLGVDGKETVPASVASFFVSRVDTEVDARLEAIGSDTALALRGKAGVAQAQIAYKIFLQEFSDVIAGSDPETKLQRLLWASTSTKNPDYDDLLYVKELVARYTVNTLPNATIDAINDHGNIQEQAINEDYMALSQLRLDALAAEFIDMKDVCNLLETQGVAKFKASFESLLGTIAQKIK